MVYLFAILAYLLVLTGVGIYKSRQVKTQADFAVAGRSLSPWILVCTMLAADCRKVATAVRYSVRSDFNCA